jgi:2-keto-3-deoxy-L-fuconate dehydrogenase
MNQAQTLEFEGSLAIVTGGASGIGRAVAELLLSRGAKVAVLDINTVNTPAGALAFSCDVSDRASVESAVNSAANELGGVDIVINNAGIGAQGRVDANDDAEWQRVLSVNVTSIARVTSAALPYLRKSQHAAVVNTSSIAATAGLPERVLYSATKGAVYSMTLAMAADHIHEGIRVNAVCPGTANTPWVTNGLMSTAADPEEELRQLNARQPHGRLVEADEVARSIAFLASPDQGSTTATALTVDGGMQGLRLRQTA